MVVDIFESVKNCILRILLWKCLQPWWAAYHRIIVWFLLPTECAPSVIIYSRHVDRFPSFVKLNKGPVHLVTYILVAYVRGSSLILLKGFTWVWKPLNCSLIRGTWVSKQVNVALKLLLSMVVVGFFCCYYNYSYYQLFFKVENSCMLGMDLSN